MIIVKEESLTNFGFWSGGKSTVQYLASEEIETIESMLEELHPNGMTETEINDFFWFNDETIAEWLGYSSFDEIMSRKDVRK